MPDIYSFDRALPPGGAVAAHSYSSHPEPDVEDLSGHEEIPGHALGVKPSGNALLAAENLRHAIGTFNILPDESILMLLEYLDGPCLLNIGLTC